MLDDLRRLLDNVGEEAHRALFVGFKILQVVEFLLEERHDSGVERSRSTNRLYLSSL